MHPWRQLFFSAMLFMSIALLSGCSTPASRIRDFASDSRYGNEVIRADGFDHQVFTQNLGARDLASAGRTLHVYLEGDGEPWRHRVVIMPDPTPPTPPLMLRLMATDPLPAVHVGRPCYNGFSRDTGCHFSLWTSARFSPTVIDSMAGVIRLLQRRHRVSKLWLIGHSGGGALALLLASRLPDVSHVITLGGNLDTDAWTAHHRYTPLYESLNPASEPPLREAVRQWHLTGIEDQVIPPRLVEASIRRQPTAVGIELAGFTHSCCWPTLWPDLLQSVAEDAPEQVNGTIIWRAPGLSSASP